MQSLTSCLKELNDLLDELISIATSLKDLTQQVFSEKEFVFYQNEQRSLLAQIDSINQVIELHYLNEMEKDDDEKLQKKIHLFQSLNHEYIQNLKKNHGLIHFEVLHPHDPEELAELSHLHKINFATKSTPTVKSKKTKKS